MYIEYTRNADDLSDQCSIIDMQKVSHVTGSIILKKISGYD